MVTGTHDGAAIDLPYQPAPSPAPTKFRYADRTQTINKIHPMRADCSMPEAFADGDTRRLAFRYAAAKSDVAENVLALLWHHARQQVNAASVRGRRTPRTRSAA